MARRGFPRIWLQHKVTVEPYTAWNTYGPAVVRRGLVQDEPVIRSTKAGIVHHTRTTFYAPLAGGAGLGVCPVGSKLLLPDGRRGFAAAAIVNGGVALPLPEHLEVAVDIAQVVSAPAGETVQWLCKTLIGRDSVVGNDVYETTTIPVPGCTVRFQPQDDTLRGGQSNEDHEDRGTHIVSTGTVIAPPGTGLKAIDRLRVRGLLYDVDGTPVQLQDAMTGVLGGVEVHIRRVTG